jgi:uncharacterized membrane protein
MIPHLDLESERMIEMAEMIGPIELVVAAFNDETKAGAVLKDLKALEKDGMILLVNAAVMVKDDKGKISIKETDDITGGKGALFGAVAGGLIGLMGGPVGVIIGAAAGAATGGVAANKIDMGFPDDMLKEMESSLPPGSSAILALIQHQWVDTAVAELEKAGAKLFRQAIKDELASQLAEDEAKTGEDAQP